MGEDRLLGELNTFNPEVLLLMEGTNDINNGASNIPEALESLEDMIDIARRPGHRDCRVSSRRLRPLRQVGPTAPPSR